jgi:hypothetical protein
MGAYTCIFIVYMGTFGVIYIYFRLFALFWKNKYIFQYHNKQKIIYKDSSQFLFGSWSNHVNQVVHTLAYSLCGLPGVYNVIEVISSWTEQIIGLHS